MRAAIIFAAVLVLGLCGDARSQSSEAWIFGTIRCATWLSNPTYEDQGKLWMACTTRGGDLREPAQPVVAPSSNRSQRPAWRRPGREETMRMRGATRLSW